VIGIAVTFLLYAIYEKHYNFIIYILGLIGYFIWSHYREGTVFLATQAFHKQDYEKTKALLAEIKDPDKLRKKRRNYYVFMMGNIADKEGRIDDAEYHFQLASFLPWKRDAEKGFVLIDLANSRLRKRNYDRDTAFFEFVSKLKLIDTLKAVIDKVEKELNRRS